MEVTVFLLRIKFRSNKSKSFENEEALGHLWANCIIGLELHFLQNFRKHVLMTSVAWMSVPQTSLCKGLLPKMALWEVLETFKR
jgi:hypothetical protein